MESISEVFQIQSPLHRAVHFGKENTITPTEVSFAVKTLKGVGCDDIRPEMLKALNRGDLWLTRVCQVAWCSGDAPKHWQTGVIIPTRKRETGVNATTTGAFLFLASMEKCMQPPYDLQR